ncbi:MAG: sodium:solute symporter family protein [Negativicutes bacterium]|nr:sodium:solute symporter family protein [Negativicutes bacterium]
MNGYLVVIVVYSILMVGIGFLLTKKVTGATDFFTAGRSLSSRMLFTTLLAANIGAGSTVGVAGLAYKYGISAWWWIGGSGLGSLILAFWVGPKIYQIAKLKQYLTLGDYLEERYSKYFRSFISLLLGIGTLAIFGGQLIGIAWILKTVAEVPKEVGVILGAGVVVLYSVAGGLLSAAGVNLIQVVIKLVGFILAGIAAYMSVGGFSGIIDKSTAIMGANSTQQAQYFSWDGIGLTVIIGFFLMMTPSFFVSPGLIGKVYGAESSEAVKKGTAWNGIAQLIFGFLIVFLGISTYVMFPDLANPELALPTAIVELMPFWISALALAAIFSAEVSTADAVLYMIAGAWANDIYKGILNPTVSTEKLLFVSRVVMLIGGIFGILLALKLPDIISSLTIFYTLMSVSLTVPLLFGLFTSVADSRGAILSSAVGILVTLYFQSSYSITKGIWILNPQSTGILISFFVMLSYISYKKLCRGNQFEKENS